MYRAKLGKSFQKAKATESLIRRAKILRLIINDSKTKYMWIGRDGCQIQQAAGLRVGGCKFEEVKNFKYLSTNLQQAQTTTIEKLKTYYIGKQIFLRFFWANGFKVTGEKI